MAKQSAEKLKIASRSDSTARRSGYVCARASDATLDFSTLLSRRSVVLSAGCALAAPFINRGRFALFAGTSQQYSSLAIDLIASSVVIDMLGLLTLNYSKLIGWQTSPASFSPDDLRRLKESGTTIFHPAVGFVDGDVYAASLRNVTRWNEFIAAHPRDFLRIGDATDLQEAKARGKIGILIGLQNSAHFRTIEDVDRFHDLGQRVSQLTYDHNRLGGGSSGPRDEGLSEFGARVVERMNRAGMAIDISHCSDRTTLDAIAVSTKPVLVTHSNCRSLVPGSARCKTDEAIRKLAAKGGVMGVTMVRTFVGSRQATIDGVLDHIDRVARIAGIEHAGLGTDVDLAGRDHGAARYDLDGVHYSKKIFDVAEGLVRRKYGAADIRRVLGGNFQRTLGAIFSPTAAL